MRPQFRFLIAVLCLLVLTALACGGPSPNPGGPSPNPGGPSPNPGGPSPNPGGASTSLATDGTRRFVDGAFALSLPDWPEIAVEDEATILAVSSEGWAITVGRHEAVPRTIAAHFARILPDYGDFQNITYSDEDPLVTTLAADVGGPTRQHARFVFRYCDGASYQVTGSAPAAQFEAFSLTYDDAVATLHCAADVTPVADNSGLNGLIVNPAGGDYALANYHAALVEARAAGADVTHLFLPWAEVETAPGEYDWTLADHLIDPPALAGFRLSLVINFIHTSLPGPMPPDLEGRDYADPDVVARAAAFAAAVAERYGDEIDYLALGNEVNIYFAMEAGAQETYLAAWRALRAAVAAVRPDLPTGVTLAFHELQTNGTLDLIDQFAEGDFLAFTYYPHDPGFDYNIPPDRFVNVLDAMIDASGSTPFIIVENGFATAPSLGGGEARQAAYVAATMAALAARPGTFGRHVWYGQHDGLPGGCTEAALSFFPAGFDPADAGAGWARFEDYLCTLGLKRYDGSAKAAWGVFTADADTR